MKHVLRSILSYMLLMAATNAFAQFSYISPMPGSKMHNKETNIILKNGGFINASSLKSDLVTISGTLSGLHTARIVLSTDRKTICIYPEPMLKSGETVTVNVADGFQRTDGAVIKGTSFKFETHSERTPEQQQKLIQRGLVASHQNEWGDAYQPDNGGGVRLNCDSIIPFTLTYNSNAWDANAFYYNFYTSNPTCWARTILSNEGNTVYAGFDNTRGIAFDINHNGYLTYYDVDSMYWLMADSSYNVVKVFKMGNGYRADEHEFLVFPNGNSWMLAYDTQPYDLTPWGGDVTDSAQGGVIQELDANDNVIFQWRSWDYISVGDGIYWQQNTIPNLNIPYDYVHLNSLELQNDSSLIVSSRHLCEVTKINLNTGDITWRMGGENNQFTFVNDSDTYNAPDGHTYYFGGQHDVRILPNGHLTMFNNDNSFQPIRSGGKEYILNEVTKTATQVWRYVHPYVNGNNLASNAMGSVQRLPNGNTFINWGLIPNPVLNTSMPKITEVDSLGNIVWEFRWTPPDTTILYTTYRARKHLWERCDLINDATLIEDSIGIFSANLSWGTNSKISDYVLEYKECGAVDWISVPLDTNYFELLGLTSNTCYEWRVQSICPIYTDSAYTSTQQFTTNIGVNIYSVADEISSFGLFPNPASNAVEAKFTIATNQEVEFAMYNLLGVLIKKGTLSAHAGTNKVTLELGNVSSGMYTVELKAGSQIMRHRLVVN